MDNKAVIFTGSEDKINLTMVHTLNSLFVKLNRSLPEIFPHADYKSYELISGHVDGQKVIICLGNENYLSLKKQMTGKNSGVKIYRIIDFDVRNVRKSRLNSNIQIQKLCEEIEKDLTGVMTC